jgi:cytidine deaminase
MLTNESRQKLLEAAKEVRSYAYAPYSMYSVGASLIAESGKIYTGVNIENASYPAGMCAERTAIFKAISEGEKKFAAMAVVTDNGGAPCGICRQVLAEFGLDVVVIIADGKGKIVLEAPLKSLLPNAFTPADLPDRPTSP